MTRNLTSEQQTVARGGNPTEDQVARASAIFDDALQASKADTEEAMVLSTEDFIISKIARLIQCIDSLMNLDCPCGGHFMIYHAMLVCDKCDQLARDKFDAIPCTRRTT